MGEPSPLISELKIWFMLKPALHSQTLWVGETSSNLENLIYISPVLPFWGRYPWLGDHLDKTDFTLE